MKLKLLESGLQNMNTLAKQYNKAKIYFHMDMDGVTSAIAMKYYLKKYGIETVDVQKIQYGSLEYSISKPESKDILPVLVDFAHGKTFMKIHTDHHESQIQYDTASNQFRHAKSNAGVISAVISPSDIFSKEDAHIIDMIDSAGYADEGLTVEQLRKAVFYYNNEEDASRNHLKFGLIVGKLVLAYKNKPNYLETIVMESKPSLMSMFNVMMKMISTNVINDVKGWVMPSQLEKNAEWYAKNQEKNKIPNGTINDINTLTYGQNTIIGNTIIQVGGGLMNRAGSYDRYTAFNLYPEAKYFIMIWDSIGMMQVSKNSWNKENNDNNVNLGDIVIRDIFANKYEPLLNNEKYDISLLAIKKTLEEGITEANESSAVGFDYNEFIHTFNKDYDVNERIQYNIEKCMNLKPSNMKPNKDDTEDQIKLKMKIVKFLNKFTIPLPELILKTSGGHPAITNLNGFAFLNTQRKINLDLLHGRNPYEKFVRDPNWKPDPNKPRKESVSLKILRSIAKDVVKRLIKS